MTTARGTDSRVRKESSTASSESIICRPGPGGYHIYAGEMPSNLEKCPTCGESLRSAEPARLPDEIILGGFDEHIRITVKEPVKGDDPPWWRVWTETETGGGLYALCPSDQTAYLVAHALDVLLHARKVGPLRESAR